MYSDDDDLLNSGSGNDSDVVVKPVFSTRRSTLGKKAAKGDSDEEDQDAVVLKTRQTSLKSKKQASKPVPKAPRKPRAPSKKKAPESPKPKAKRKNLDQALVTTLNANTFDNTALDLTGLNLNPKSTRLAFAAHSSSSRTKIPWPVPTPQDKLTSKYAMEIRSLRGNNLRTVVGIHAYLIPQAILRFNEHGIFIYATDSNCIALLLVELYASSFEKFYCPEPFEFGVDLSYLNRTLGPVNTYKTMSFIVRSREHSKSLLLVMENEETRIRRCAELYSLTVPMEDISIPDQQYDSTMTFPSQAFQSYITDLTHQGQTVTFSTDYNVLYMTCRGKHGNTWIKLEPSKKGLSFNNEDRSAPPAADAIMDDVAPVSVAPVLDQEAPDAATMYDQDLVPVDQDPLDDICQPPDLSKMLCSMSYMLKYINGFCKATPLSPYMKMCFGGTDPLVLIYDIYNMGKFTFCLSNLLDEEADAAADALVPQK